MILKHTQLYPWRKYLCWGFLLLCTSKLWSQQVVIDSLQRLLATPMHDTLRVVRQIELANAYTLSEPDKARHILHDAYYLAKKHDFYPGQARVLNGMGIIHTVYGEYEEAIRHYLEALDFAENYHLTKLKISILGNLGVLYAELTDAPNALKYYHLSLDAARKERFASYEGTSLNNIGNVWLKSYHNLDTAFLYFKQSLKVRKECCDSVEYISALNSLGRIFTEKGNIDSAKYYLEMALQISQKKQRLSLEIETRIYLSKIYIKQKKYDKAEQEIVYCLSNSKKLRFDKGMLDSYLVLADIYQATGRLQDANQCLRQRGLVRDSIATADLNTKARHLNKSMATQARLRELTGENHRQNQWLLSMGVMVILLIASGIILLRITQSRNRAIRRLHALSAQMQTLNLELEYRVQSRTAELEARNAQLEAYTHHNSHEVRARLATLMGVLEVFRLYQLPPAIEKWVAILAVEANALDKTLHQNNEMLTNSTATPQPTPQHSAEESPSEEDSYTSHG